MNVSIMPKLKHSLSSDAKQRLLLLPFIAMDNEVMTIQERIKEAIDSMGRGGKTKLSKECDVTAQAITGWIKYGRVDKSNLAVLAKLSGYNFLWLATGEGSKRIHDTSGTMVGSGTMISNVEPGPQLGGKVPLISWVQAGSASEVIDLLQPGEGFDWIETTCQIKQHTYALRVVGDSMTPDFPEGVIIVVEPEMEPNPGDYVIARNGDDEATFKQLVKDGADYYLKPINDRYPIKPLGNYHVIGVVREMVRRFR